MLAKVIVDKKNAGQAGGKAGKTKDKIKAGKAGKIEDKKKAGKAGKKIDKKKAGKAGSVDKKREAGGVSGLIRKIKSWKDGLFDNPFGHSEQFIRSLKCRFDVPNAVKRKLPQRSKEEKARRFRIERIETGQRWLYQANKENDIDARRGAGLRYSKKFKRWLGHSGPFWANLGHPGPFRAFWVIPGHSGPFWANLGRFGPFRVFFDIFDDLGSFLAILCFLRFW